MDPLELASVAAIILVFFLWGPQRLPELAKVVAQARKEFDNATREMQKVSSGILDGTSPFVAPLTPTQPPPAQAPGATPQAPAGTAPPQAAKPALPSPPTAPPSKTGDELLIETARKLGIQTTGRTREQIQADIIAMAMAKQPAASPTAQTPPKAADPAA